MGTPRGWRHTGGSLGAGRGQGHEGNHPYGYRHEERDDVRDGVQKVRSCCCCQDYGPCQDGVLACCPRVEGFGYRVHVVRNFTLYCLYYLYCRVYNVLNSSLYCEDSVLSCAVRTLFFVVQNQRPRILAVTCSPAQPNPARVAAP